jgi:hypothetical protein
MILAFIFTALEICIPHLLTQWTRPSLYIIHVTTIHYKGEIKRSLIVGLEGRKGGGGGGWKEFRPRRKGKRAASAAAAASGRLRQQINSGL